MRACAASNPQLFAEDAPEPVTPAAFRAHARAAQAAPAVAAAPAATIAASAAPTVVLQPAAAPAVQFSPAAVAAALNALPALRAPASSSISQRRAQPAVAAAAAASAAPVRAAASGSRVAAASPLLAAPSQVHLQQRPRFQSAYPSPTSESELDDEEERAELEDAMGGLAGYSTAERSGSLIAADDMEAALAAAGIHAAFAPDFIRNMQLAAGHRSILDLYRDICRAAEWVKQKHARLEALTLAQAIDTVLAGKPELTLEVLTRRLAAVQTGVETGNWDVGRAWDMPSQRTSFVSDRAMIHALKAQTRDRFVHKGGDTAGAYGSGASSSSRYGNSKSTSGGSRSGNGGASRGGDRREGQPPSSASGAGSSSSTKKSGSNKK